MENIILRAMRTFDESVCAPEYARNQLGYLKSYSLNLLFL